jgi:hypothetical protein
MTTLDRKYALHQDWQNFRIRCLELAIKAGADEGDTIQVADQFGTYILTVSDREKLSVERDLSRGSGEEK